MMRLTVREMVLVSLLAAAVRLSGNISPPGAAVAAGRKARRGFPATRPAVGR